MTSTIEQQITIGARTVTQLAVHLQELAQQAVDLSQTLKARDRGYFLPTEDEQVRHILVSYWQSRAALFEVVQGLRGYIDFVDAQSDQRPLIVPYAAAVLRIDAGRTLRELFDDVSVVRDKLNEADPTFKIPPGVYNTVQKSLTAPNHAWYLHQANTYYDEHHAQLSRAANAHEEMGSAFAVIERLGHRVRVTPSQYTKARVDVRADQLKRAVAEKGICRAMYFVQEVVGRMIGQLKIRPTHQPVLPDQVTSALGSIIAPRDVFVTRKEYAATNYFLPGFWPHAALYLGDIGSIQEMGPSSHEPFQSRWDRLLELDDQDSRRVLEAMADGVWLRSVRSPFSVDSVAVIRPNITPGQISDALVRGMAHESKPYDFDFDFTRSDRLVCTEVVYRTYDGIEGMDFKLTRRAGRMTLAAEDLLRMAIAGTGFEPVAVFAADYDSALTTGEKARQLLRQTVAKSYDLPNDESGN